MQRWNVDQVHSFAVLLRTLTFAFCLMAAQAHASSAGEALDAARAAKARLDLPQALEATRTALAGGTASVDETALLYTLQAEVLAAMGLRDDAVTAFARALSLAPSTQPPPNASPKLSEPFKAAVARVQGKRLTASPRTELTLTRARTEVDVRDDTERLVEGGVLFARRSDSTFAPTRLSRTAVLEAAWECPSEACDYYVVLTDKAGNALLSLGTEQAPLRAMALPTPAPPVATVAASPLRWAGRIGALVAMVGSSALAAGFAVKFQADQARAFDIDSNKASHTFAQLQAADRARTTDRALLIGGSIGAAVFATTAVIIW